tara:strand:- start:13683 stop:15074 length:1392 start_codon:yes stop_codon:yes gene_type:complete
MKRLLKEGLNIENHINEIKRKLDFSAFKIRDNLNGDIWNSDDEINEEVKDNLISIAEYYWDSLDLGISIIDITITGSLANYNWSRFSDIDLHIIFNLDNFGEHNDLIKELLDSKTRTWNTQHDIKIKDFEVEIYLQPEGQPHHSTGVYSLLNDEWIKKPEKMVVNIDKANVRKKYNKLISHIDDIEKDLGVKKDYEDIINRVESIKDKIKNMRKSGLESGGQFSIENIVFKLLRRNEIMSKLNDLAVNAYDDMMTIDEGELTENYIRGLLRIGLLEEKQIPGPAPNDDEEDNEEGYGDRYGLLGYTEGDDYFSEVGLDEYEAHDDAHKIANDNGINILRDMDLSQVLIDFGESKDKHIRLHPRVIGGLWVNQNSSYFSFDIAIDKHYHNKGLFEMLINAAIDEYEYNKEIYGDLKHQDDDDDIDFHMEVDILTPELAKILINKYNFKVVEKIGSNRFLMTIDD